VGAGGFSYEEAAELCGCPVGTIKSRVARARSDMEALLSGALPRHGRRKKAAPVEDLLDEIDRLAG
jgi:RNA polymerase sigma-70 factor (ECF subfamily)